MYSIRKGWPAPGALDEVIPLSSATLDIKEGTIVSLVNGAAEVANYTAAETPADPIQAFVIDSDTSRKIVTALLHPCIIEIDKDHYLAGSYTPGDILTAKDGKFATGSGKAVGKVLSFAATTGQMRLLWFAAH